MNKLSTNLFVLQKSNCYSIIYDGKKLFILIFSIFYFSVLLWSEVPEGYRFVKTWKLADKFGRVDSVRVDTAHINFQNDNAIDKFSIANSYNGDLGSPIQSKIYLR